jgi:hypothetical protein
VTVRLGVGVVGGVVRVGVAVGVGRGVVRVGVADGVRRPVRVGVGVGTGVGAPLRAGDNVPAGVRGVPPAGALVVGALEAFDGVLFDRSSAGIAIPAPTTKNTAAMTNLDHCIASLSSPTRHLVNVNGTPAKPRSFFT